MTLPVIQTEGDLAVVDPDTGLVTTLRDASDRALAYAADRVAHLDRDILAAKRALAAELRDRHGVGQVHAGGYGFKIAESQSWPVGATKDALERLVADGKVSEADARRAMPDKPKPDTRALKALIGRLTVSDPEAARLLADACTTSPPSVRDVVPEAVDAEAA